jgi:hypothetical protein
MSKIPLSDQILAVERAAINLKGHIEILQGLVAQKKRDPIVLITKESWLPDLEAALVTLRWLDKNKDKLK